MSNLLILILIALFTVAQIFYSIKKNGFEDYLIDTNFFWSCILVTITFLAALIMPIKFVSKEKVPQNFISYDGATHLIIGKISNGFATMELKNTNVTIDKITFKSFFGCELVDYEINYN